MQIHCTYTTTAEMFVCGKLIKESEKKLIKIPSDFVKWDYWQ